MKKFTCILLALCCYIGQLQGQTTKPVKKVVTSKITRDPKTGRLVKTITTTIVTKVDAGAANTPKASTTQAKASVAPKTASTTTQAAKPAASTAQATKPVAKTTSQTAATKPAAKATPKATKPPVVSAKPAVTKAKATTTVVKTSTEADKTIITKEEEENSEKVDNSIFANPQDHSASNVAVVAPQTGIASTSKPVNNEDIKKEKASIATTWQPSLRIGLRGGLNIASTASPSADSFLSYAATDQGKLGPMGAVVLNYELSRRLSIQPELGLGMQGYKLTTGFDSDIKENWAINMPVLLKFALGKGPTKVFADAGPYVGFLLSSKRTKITQGQANTEIVDFAAEQSMTTKTNRIDAGAMFGLGLQHNFGKMMLEIEGRYQYGLTDDKIYTENKPSYAGETGQNRIFSGSIGLLFPIGRN